MNFGKCKDSLERVLYNLIVPEFIRGLIISSSNSVMIILARVGPGDEPIETPSICL
jgi:hypothetical protein